MTRLVVVSNRVARTRRASSGGEGGLSVGVLSALREVGGIWFGWSGETVEGEPRKTEIATAGRITFATVDLGEKDYEEYYYGYANRTLWPLFHYRPGLTEFHRHYFTGYERVNALFASRLLPLLKPDDLIWVHDFHLIPMAAQLRQAGCSQRLGFFLHIPWPTLPVFLALPNHLEIVRALCQYDLVGFQTQDYVDAFCDYILHEAGGNVREDGRIYAFGRSFKVGAFPIGIDTGTIAAFARKAGDSRQTKRLKESLNGRELILGVDRLDYSKGLVQRMDAYAHLLENYPENRGHVVMLQITPPSRTDVPEYVEIRHELEAAAGHVNGTYAEYDWVPTRYINRGYNRRTLAGFYRISRVGLVTPLRDGMNLVAKEFVAAQSRRDPGVLVLSRFAGSARELDGAVIVNPYDVEGVGESLQKALVMPLEERRERWSTMYNHLKDNDVTAWRKGYLDALVEAAPGR
ncbi:MAG: alpha,alpha-trehalose-phosphate synthase (UDP-forming) [Alphaproteobacteria bacterium]|nr:alpha,alpha-trehalose-phosphate synthase (UDP-forming) [Alphaproteobacteria bacterium]